MKTVVNKDFTLFLVLEQFKVVNASTLKHIVFKKLDLDEVEIAILIIFLNKCAVNQKLSQALYYEQLLEEVAEHNLVDKKFFQTYQLQLRILQLIEKGYLVCKVESEISKNFYIDIFTLHESHFELSPTVFQVLHSETSMHKGYKDSIDFIIDQSMRIKLYKALNSLSGDSFFYSSKNNSNIHLKHQIFALESQIQNRLFASKKDLDLVNFIGEQELNDREEMIIYALFCGEIFNIKDLRSESALLEIISENDIRQFVENKALLKEEAPLLEKDLIDYYEDGFEGERIFFLQDRLLQFVDKKSTKQKMQMGALQKITKEYDFFELITPQTDLKKVVLDEATKKGLCSIVALSKSSIGKKLDKWGVKKYREGIDARIIFFGPPGTGKTLTATALAKTLGKEVLSLDCSKVLSKWMGESEQNVRKIFDIYKEIAHESGCEPVLLLNEADQFLTSRSGNLEGAGQMYNQMQNIFLEQIERFEGVLVATTNLVDNLDKAFSRRFEHKFVFKRPNFNQRLMLWETYLPKNTNFEKGFDLKILAKHDLSGAQIKLIIKNAAYKVASEGKNIFALEDFEQEIKKESSSSFESEKVMGFLSG